MSEDKVTKDPEVWGGLLPKIETQSLGFLKKNPSMDGRGIIVGVLDTGVDPGAIGLQKTTEGLPKVIDIIDCTGSGDVAMHGPTEVTAGGHLVGFTGRNILVNPNWCNPTGKFFVGVKKLDELYTRELKKRMQEKRKKTFDKLQKEAEKSVKEKINSSSSSSSSPTSKLDADDLTAQLSTLRELGDQLCGGAGPALDCVVFHDGERWRAVVDCTGTGDMSSAAPMADFSHEQEYRTFSKEDAFNFGVHIYDEGRTLSIVVDSGAHGTHVAGIIAAYHPLQPEINGVAPGAQIVSLKIGDTRINAGETGPGLIRALLEAMKHKCNVINMSFGEAAQFDNTGAFVKLAEEMVYRHGVTFLSSAGNNGPNLSTVGAPMASCIISVGAFVTKSLMRTAYSIHEADVSKIPECNYTWSSMGPVVDGDLGVSLLAPGGATTCVPNWTLSRHQLMNGTSMSSPNACGCFALLLSGLKQTQSQSDGSEAFIVSPPRLRLAVENSCKHIDEVHILGQNHGLIQVEDAWQHLLTHAGDSTLDIPLRFEVMSKRFSRGIYLRQPSESSVSSTFKVEIKPQFDLLPQEGEKEMFYFGGRSVQATKIGFEMRLTLVSSCDWIKAPNNVLLAQAGKLISVYVDPTQLDPGLHVEFVYAYDDNNPQKGCVFKIPVTVIKPEVIAPQTLAYSFGTNLLLPPTERIRRFLVPPAGCSFIDVVVTDRRSKSSCSGGNEDCSDSSTRMIVLHALQLLPGEPYRDHEKEVYLQLTPGSEHCVSCDVEPNLLMELTLTRFWNTLGDVLCDVTVLFRGITPYPSSVSIYQGQKANSQRSRVRLLAELQTCDVLPSASLTTWSRTIAPIPLASGKSSRTLPLGERDVLPSGNSVYQLVLEYNLDIEEEKNTSVILRWPIWNEILYESPFSGQFFMIYDSQKQLVSTGDAYPDRMKVNLKKGHYTVRLQVRHDDSAVLESYDSTPLVLERKLDSPIKVPCYASQADALLNKSVETTPVFVGTSTSVVFGEPGSAGLPSTVLAGDVFHGKVTYLKKPSTGTGSGTRPGGYPISFFCTGAKPTKTAVAKPESESGSSSIQSESKNVLKKDEETKVINDEKTSAVLEMDEKLSEAIRDVKLKYLSDLGAKEVAKVIMNDLDKHPFHAAYIFILSEFPEHIPLHLKYVEYLMKCASVCSDKLIDAEAKTLKDNNIEEEKTCKEKEVESTSDIIARRIQYLREAIAVADNVFSKIDKVAILTELGVLIDSNDSVAVKRRKDVNNIKLQLVKALGAKCHATIALTEIYEAIGQTVEIATCSDLFESTYKELSKFDDIEKSEIYWELLVFKHNRANRHGLSLKRINEMITKDKLSASPSPSSLKKLYKARDNCLRSLGWQHIINLLEAEKEMTKNDKFLPF